MFEGSSLPTSSWEIWVWGSSISILSILSDSSTNSGWVSVMVVVWFSSELLDSVDSGWVTFSGVDASEWGWFSWLSDSVAGSVDSDVVSLDSEFCGWEFSTSFSSKLLGRERSGKTVDVPSVIAPTEPLVVASPTIKGVFPALIAIFPPTTSPAVEILAIFWFLSKKVPLILRVSPVIISTLPPLFPPSACIEMTSIPFSAFSLTSPAFPGVALEFILPIVMRSPACRLIFPPAVVPMVVSCPVSMEPLPLIISILPILLFDVFAVTSPVLTLPWILVILTPVDVEILPVEISLLVFIVIWALSTPVIVPVPVIVSAWIAVGSLNTTPFWLLFSVEAIVILPEFSDFPIVIDSKPFAKVAKSPVVRCRGKLPFVPSIFSKLPRVISWFSDACCKMSLPLLLTLSSPPKRLISSPVIVMLPVSRLPLDVDIPRKLRVFPALISIFPPLCVPSALMLSVSMLVAVFIVIFPPLESPLASISPVVIFPCVVISIFPPLCVPSA